MEIDHHVNELKGHIGDANKLEGMGEDIFRQHQTQEIIALQKDEPKQCQDRAKPGPISPAPLLHYVQKRKSGEDEYNQCPPTLRRSNIRE